MVQGGVRCHVYDTVSDTPLELTLIRSKSSILDKWSHSYTVILVVGGKFTMRATHCIYSKGSQQDIPCSIPHVQKNRICGSFVELLSDRPWSYQTRTTDQSSRKLRPLCNIDH